MDMEDSVKRPPYSPSKVPPHFPPTSGPLYRHSPATKGSTSTVLFVAFTTHVGLLLGTEEAFVYQEGQQRRLVPPAI